MIPAISGKLLDEINASIRNSGSPGNVYQLLSSQEKDWINLMQKNGQKLMVSQKSFMGTDHHTIALELIEAEFEYSHNYLSVGCVRQPIALVHYAHDSGDKRIILINKTSYNNQELLQHIYEDLPKEERERIASRLGKLLCETEDTIFDYYSHPSASSNS